MKLLSILIFSIIYCNSKAQLLDSLTLANLPQEISLDSAKKNPESVVKLVLRKQKLKEFPIEIFKI